ncbi:hypothetical protein NT06LI_1960 [Listeria innocua FSL J1-023]|nr:hypothetical protein NT06LI_1960 [Listeria innocua FSL J1-023]
MLILYHDKAIESTIFNETKNDKQTVSRLLVILLIFRY